MDAASASPLSATTTDLYQLTMAAAYLRAGLAEREAVFHLSFRRNPFAGGYAVAAGLAPALAYLRDFRFTEEELGHLANLTGSDERPLFDAPVLGHLRGLRLRLDVDAVPEGTAVFPWEPVLRVRGPLLECQLVETALLNTVNFQTLIATKAARVVHAARGGKVLELGLRRAQGPDGALSASRAAFLGGAAGTSNVDAARRLGIPVAGTHAHSFVMAFDGEPEAFAAWSEALPNAALFLVDTFDSLEGVRNAVAEGRRLRERGHRLVGVRLDSGDLAWLSREARRILDEAGFPDAVVVASNDLDERSIESLVAEGARIDVWGVGTNLVTGGDQPALGGVYKLGALRKPGGGWERKLKLSEQAAKTSLPGILGIRRHSASGQHRGDLLWDELDGAPASGTGIVDPKDPTRLRGFDDCDASADLLRPVLRHGEPVADEPSLVEIRRHAAESLARLDPAVRRLSNPHEYPVGLDPRLAERRTRMILEARKGIR